MTHDERVYYHLYTKAKAPLENAELIASLEELVLDMYEAYYYERPSSAEREVADRMTELGVER